MTRHLAASAASGRRVAALALACAGLAACAHAPDELPPPALTAAAPLAGVPVDNAAHWPAADWWRRYSDPQLDELEALALHDAPSLVTARSRFETALRSVEQARARAGAHIDADAQLQRQRISENGLFPVDFLGFTWYSQGDLSLQFSYDFDFWDRRRAAIEATVDRARAAQAESNAAALMLTTAVADTYFAWQGDQARAALAQDGVRAQEQSRDIVAARTRRGIENPDDLHEVERALAQAREQQLAMQGAARVRLVALAALLGVSPADLPELQPRPLPQVAHGIPPGAGLDLVARRPDIAASRWRVEAAVQDVSQARAAFFPDISLEAMAGFSSIDLDKLLDPGSRVFRIAPAIHLPLFDGGALRAQYGFSRAQLDSAIADYHSAVVEAGRDAATQALTLDLAQQRATERATQVAATQRLRDAAAARVRSGITDRRALISADTELVQQRDAAAVLKSQQVAADIALIKALGGGYSVETDADSAAVTSRIGPQGP